ncbi:MAG TPA: class I SAM-dependent methyltransferase [Bryobacteraceae bacterium]|jgi:predicted O-methyltransferase YrrM|nr:class I SAM-dependent methyltransferase [Bryobacteraceae bacterium]
MFQFTPSPELERYIYSVSVREPDVLRRLRQETAALPNASCQISPEQGQFMAFLVQAIGARRCIEIGVFTGYSSTVVALALPADGELIACDINAEWTAVATRYWREAGVARKISLRLAPALDTLDRLIAEGRAGAFDFAFIDADKENYWNYYERCLRLVRKRGIIAIDNVLWSGRVLSESALDNETKAIREFNQALARDERVFVSMLPIRDGVTLALKK